MSSGTDPNIEVIHTQKNDPSYNLPYAPAIKVHGGKLLFTAAMAAPRTTTIPTVPKSSIICPKTPRSRRA
jgi:hypothetical protein